MATYRQDDTTYEDGYGELAITYMISDTWDGLFTSTSYAVKIIEPTKLKFKREQKIGQLALDEFKFKINETLFSYDDSTIIDSPKTQLDIERDLLSLCLASDVGSLTYIGVFINASATPTIGESIYVGAVNSKISFDDQFWHDDEYGVAPTPLREYDFESLPSEEAVFNHYSLQDIVDGIDSTWENTFVFNGRGFYKEGSVETRIPRLVHVHELFNKLVSVYEGLLLAGGFGTWNFSFANSKMDGKYSPVRWRRAFESNLFGPIVGGELLINSSLTRTVDIWNQIKIYDDEARELYISAQYIPDSSYGGPYVPYSVVKPNVNTGTDDRNEYNLTAAEDYLWQNIDRTENTFTGLLYSIATDLGLSLKFTFTAKRNVTISFVSKSAKASNSKIYLRDVSKASGEINELGKRDDNRKLRGSISYLIAEPNENNYKFSEVINQLDPHVASDGYPLFEKGVRDSGLKNTISIGATVWGTYGDLKWRPLEINTILAKGDANTGCVLKVVQIPYNMYLSDSSGNKIVLNKVIGNSVPYNSVSFSNQLYMKVDKRVGETNCPDTYYTQIGRLEIKEEGTDKYYYSLADYVNRTNTKDQEKYSTKYKLDIPYLMCASNSSDGSSPSIFNLGIDKIIEIDGLDYIIDEYEIDLQKLNVKLQISAIGRFEYGTATGRDDDGVVGFTIPSEVDDSPEIISDLTLRNSGIKEGEFVSRVSETEVERTAPLEAHYGRLLGVARHDADQDDPLTVQTSGDVEISWLSGSVNDAVFVKKVSATQNLSTTPITTKTVDEDLYAEVGRIVGTNKMRIGIKEHFVIE